MSHPKTTRKISSVSDELIFYEILPKLPAKSLIRFKSVCKLWKSSISDPNSFKISMKNRDKTLLISKKGLYLMNHEFQPENLPIPHPYPVNKDVCQEILGTCDGLILFRCGIDIFMWNPSTAYCDKVHELDLIKHNDYSIDSGFFFDIFAQEYKVVVSLIHSTPSYGGQFVISSGLKSKEWRKVSFPYSLRTICCGPVVNNRLHWAVNGEIDEGYENITVNGEIDEGYENIDDDWGITDSIVYFDSLNNEFKMLPVPEPIKEGGDEIVELGIIDKCLCMMRVASFGNVELVVMKEYGVKESWARLYCISDLYPYFSYPKLVMVIEKDDCLVFYIRNQFIAYYPNISTQEKMKIKIKGLKKYKFRDVISYVETIVSPVGYYWNDEEHKKIGSPTFMKYGIYEE